MLPEARIAALDAVRLQRFDEVVPEVPLVRVVGWRKPLLQCTEQQVGELKALMRVAPGHGVLKPSPVGDRALEMGQWLEPFTQRIEDVVLLRNPEAIQEQLGSTDLRTGGRIFQLWLEQQFTPLLVSAALLERVRLKRVSEFAAIP